MKPDKQNFNARIETSLIQRIQMESMFANLTQQDFTERVFSFFLDLPKNKRREVLKGGQ